MIQGHRSKFKVAREIGRYSRPEKNIFSYACTSPGETKSRSSETKWSAQQRPRVKLNRLRVLTVNALTMVDHSPLDKVLISRGPWVDRHPAAKVDTCSTFL